MFIGLLQLRHSLQEHQRLYLFTTFVLLTWLVWIAKVVLSRRYRPWTEPYATTTTVVIPVVDEPLDLFHEVLQRIIEQGPTQIVVVINGRRNVGLEEVCQTYEQVEWTWTPIAGKRNAVQVGVARSHGDVVLLVDSDTVWTDNTLSELVKPFIDPGVGGVTTRQRILEPGRAFLTRWADWLENSRALYSMPAQSVLGTVGCLPGRTIAFRRVILERVMHDFMHQKYLGVFLEVSDDRTLTNLTLQQGFRTVYQATSLVYTDAPLKLKKLVKQQYRWARGSQYNTLRMLPWMATHAPMLAFFFLADIALPFLWLCSAVAWGVRYGNHTGDNLYDGMLHVRQHALPAIILLTLLTSTMAMCLRQARHLAEVPNDFFWMPAYIMFSTLVLMPIRLYGFIRLAHVGGWGTRADAYTAGDSLAGGVVSPLVVPGRRAGEPVAGDVVSPLVVPAETIAPEPGGSGGTAVLTKPIASIKTAEPAPDGDPRGLIPYLIASAILIIGVVYDVRPV